MDQRPSHIGVSALILPQFIFDQNFLFLVISKLLLAIAYPGEGNPDDHQTRIRQVIGAGVQVVVNLMEDEELKTRTPYQDTMREHARQGIITSSDDCSFHTLIF